MRIPITAAALCALALHPSQTGAAPWRGDLICGDGDDRFVTERTIDIDDGRLTYASDDPVDEREIWTGAVGESALVVGDYFWRTRKPLFLIGRRDGDRLTLDGWRGPKRCRFTAQALEGGR